MEGAWKRPKPVFDASKGLLHNDHYQIAYMTNDIDRAEAVFHERYGIPRFRHTEYALPSGGAIKTRVAWVGNMAYEIMWGSGPGSELYTEGLPTDRFAIRHHHFCYLIADEASWQTVEKLVEQGGWRIRQKGGDPAFGRTMIIEAPELGHYIEYAMPGPGLIALLEATPGLDRPAARHDAAPA